MSRQPKLLGIVVLTALLAAALAPARPAPTPTGSRRGESSPASSAGGDYRDQVRKRATWPSFPLRVHFLRDEYWTQEHERAATAGLDAWVKATHSRITYRVERSRADAQVIVRFDPGSDNGSTRTRFVDQEIVWAEMIVGVESDARDDTACVAAHEFGHALGIDGHSDDSHDLMCASHRVGTGWRITDRDLNTLNWYYPPERDPSRT